jgi:hypothetical protein
MYAGYNAITGVEGRGAEFKALKNSLHHQHRDPTRQQPK